MAKGFQVFLCSTSRDLATERLLVLEALETLARENEGFSYFAPRSQPSLDTSLSALPTCDLALFVLGHCYGATAPGLQVSAAEREYQEAVSLGIPTLAFLRRDDYGLLPGQFEKDPVRSARLREFRGALAAGDCQYFSDAPSLALTLRLAVDWVIAQKELPKRFPTRSIPKTGTVTAKSVAGKEEQPDGVEGGTRTLPLLQKALNEPFSTRLPPGRRALVWGIAVLGAATLALALGWRLAGDRPWQAVSGPMKNTPLAANGMATDAHASEEPPGLPADPDTLIVAPSEDPALAALAAAHKGDAQARISVAERYEKGDGLPRNDSLAYKYYRLAAGQGHAEAQFRLALMLRQGRGTIKSLRQARAWFRAAAQQGHASAQSELGRLYLRGGGGEAPNAAEGYKWLLRAAENQDSTAIQFLAELKED